MAEKSACLASVKVKLSCFVRDPFGKADVGPTELMRVLPKEQISF